jgi:2,6-dihydroxypseudooxynicotine hydrolase
MTQMTFQVRTHSPDFATAKERLKAMDLTGVIHQVAVPGYIVTGTLDRLIPYEHARMMAEGVSGPVILDLIEGGSHVASNKAWKYRPQVADWMAGQLGAGA